MFPFCDCNSLILLRSIFVLSLHHGLAWGWRGGRVEIADADGAQQGRGAWGRSGDGAFGGAVAEVDIDDAD
jgi:hypothetical protein